MTLGYIPTRSASNKDRFKELCCPTFVNGNASYRTYGYRFFGGLYMSNPNNYTARVIKYRDYSSEWYLCDSIEDGVQFPPNIRQYWTVYANGNGNVWNAQVHRRHVNRANWLFLDGHSEQRDKAGCALLGYPKSWPPD